MITAWDIIGIIIVLVIGLAITGFVFGPYLIEEFMNKLEEWEEITARAKDEK